MERSTKNKIYLHLEGRKDLRGVKATFPLLFFFFFFAPSAVSAQQYDINDPRNPDCPCHQHQKQAEEEYERLQRQQDNPDDNNNDVDQEDNDNSEIEQQDDNDDADESASTSSGDSHHQRKLKVMKKSWSSVKKWKRKMGHKRNGTLKGRFNISGCYHW